MTLRSRDVNPMSHWISPEVARCQLRDGEVMRCQLRDVEVRRCKLCEVVRCECVIRWHVRDVELMETAKQHTGAIITILAVSSMIQCAIESLILYIRAGLMIRHVSNQYCV